MNPLPRLSNLADKLRFPRALAWELMAADPWQRSSVMDIASSRTDSLIERLSFHPQREGLKYSDVMWGIAQNPAASRQAQMNVLSWAVQEETDFSFQLLALLAENPAILPATLETAAFAVRQRWSEELADEVLAILCESPNASRELLKLAAHRLEVAEWDTAGRIVEALEAKSGLPSEILAAVSAAKKRVEPSLVHF